MKIILTAVMLFLAMFIASCSATGTAGVTPAEAINTASTDSHGGTACLGLWDISIEPGTHRVDITELRGADLILNVLQFLEPPPMVWLSIDLDTLEVKPVQKKVAVDVILKHPFNSTEFMGFDVRGIVFGPWLDNSDGNSYIMNPWDFSGVPFGYKDGLLGTPFGPGYQPWYMGFKYFCSGLGKDEVLSDFFSNPANLDSRGVFLNGDQVVRHYDLQWVDGSGYDFLEFQYAVYANYDLPVGIAPYELDDFSIHTANSAEAFCESATVTENTMWYENGEGGGWISLLAEVWDWQGDISSVMLSAGDIIDPVEGVYIGPGSTGKSFIYEFDHIYAHPTGSGDMAVGITAFDVKTIGESWFGGLLPPPHDYYDHPSFISWYHKVNIADIHEPCIDMEGFGEYEAFVKEGAPWKFMLPNSAGVTCTRGSITEPYIISGALRDYPVTFPTFGATPVSADNPVHNTIDYSSAFETTADIACDTQNYVYLVGTNDLKSLKRSYFDGATFTAPEVVHTFGDDIVRFTVDDDDNPVVLTNGGPSSGYKIFHKNGTDWVEIPVNPDIVAAGIQDFDYNPVQDHYVFVCSIIAIKMFAQDSSGVIQFTDNELFGTLPYTQVPSIYIDQDDPDCRMVCWGTIDGATTFARRVARFAAVDYTIPKVLSNFSVSDNGASTVGGAFAPGTDYLFVPAYDGAIGRAVVPVNW